jgi:hypothetical protein
MTVAVSGDFLPHGPVIAPEGHESGPICLADNELQIETHQVAIVPGRPKSGSKWQVLGRFSSICPLVYRAPAETPI